MFIADKYERVRLERLAECAVGDQVLDLGCAQLMNEGLLRPGRTVTGVDMGQPQSSVRYDRFLVGNVFELEQLDDGRLYDTIVAGEFIEHLERPYDLLRLLRARLKPGGKLVVIFRADGLSDLLAPLVGRFGGITILPVHPRPEAAAIRILLRATKGSRAPIAILPGLTLNDAEGRPTAEAEAVLRGGAALPLARL